MKINNSTFCSLKRKTLLFFVKSLVISAAFLSAGAANADTFKSKSDGPWKGANTWIKDGNDNTHNSSWPIAGDIVTIEKGHEITADGNINIASLSIVGPKSGNLILSSLNLGAYEMTVGTIDLEGQTSNNINKRAVINVTTGKMNISGTVNMTNYTEVILGTASTVNFNGSTITQNVPGLAYGNLQFNGTAAKTLAGPASVASSLFISGPLDLKGHMLDATAVGQIDMPYGGSAIGATVNGYLKIASGSRMIAHNVGSSTVEFPVGTNTFTPAYISNSGAANTFSVSVKNGVVDALGTTLTSMVVNKTWDIKCENQVGNVNATVRLQWNAADHTTNFNPLNCAVSHFDESIWRWTNNNDFGPAEGAASTGPFSKSMSNVTFFSPFAVGSLGSPLPVELTSFTAVKKELGTVLNWETASEKNNKGFEVQASADAKNYETIGLVASKNGNANYSQRYEFTDKASRAGLVYYRLKQTDLDGTVAYFAAKVVDMGRKASSVTAYPNPFSNNFTVNLSDATEMEVMDLTGRVVYRSQTTEKGAGAVTIELNNQPAGIYLLKTTTNGSKTITRLVKQ